MLSEKDSEEFFTVLCHSWKRRYFDVTAISKDVMEVVFQYRITQYQLQAGLINVRHKRKEATTEELTQLQNLYSFTPLGVNQQYTGNKKKVISSLIFKPKSEVELLMQENALMAENNSSTSVKMILLYQLSISTQFFSHAPLKHVNIMMWLLWMSQVHFYIH